MKISDIDTFVERQSAAYFEPYDEMYTVNLTENQLKSIYETYRKRLATLRDGLKTAKECNRPKLYGKIKMVDSLLETLRRSLARVAGPSKEDIEKGE